MSHAIQITGHNTTDEIDNYFAINPSDSYSRSKILERINDEGMSADAIDWNILLTHFQGMYRSAKSEWEYITGQRFGSVKSGNWRPDNLPITEMRSVEELCKASVAAEEAADKSAGHKRVLQLRYEEKDKEMKALYKSFDDACTTLGSMDDNLNFNFPIKNEADRPKFVARQEEEKGKLNRLVAAKQRKVFKCGVCDSDIVFSLNDPTTLIKPDSSIQSPSLDRDIKECEEVIKDCKEAISSCDDIVSLRKRVKAKEDEMAKLTKEINDIGDDAPEAEDAQKIERLLQAATRLVKANEKLQECRDWAELVEACSETGIRKLAMDKTLSEINNALTAYSVLLHFPIAVSMTEDGQIMVKRKEYDTEIEYASQSEKWMANLVYQMTAATKTKARYIVIDEADILDEEQAMVTMPDLFMSHNGRVIVGMTRNEWTGDGKYDFEGITTVQLS